ncbi:LacI family DNA-binding transcriptional regulator [Oceanicella sp. SM1341]|uniref:LacI family DNA-binding transcriptional regulator n=1 Tax=Oceanicella sp. SM1341 TaxID=1548889 RepID=UPI001E58EE45|nr:LacI family DNA-binding transcriptional regulator [Oceanicella sp. SM1341]
MALRSTLTDIARAAGVSSATVDRVLNNREGVRPRTREMVLEAAGRLGYLPSGRPLFTAAMPVRLDFVMPVRSNPFIGGLCAEIEAQAARREGLEVRVHGIDGINPQALARALTALPETQGVGLIALDHPAVREAVRALSARGVKVATLVSDLPDVPRIGYVGIDNRAAGRLAGYLLGRLLGQGTRQRVAVFAGSLSYRGHEEREMGFRAILAEDFPDFEVVELREIRDDPARAVAETRALLAAHPDITGIYNIGAGNPGIAEGLRAAALPRRPVFVGHELTAQNKTLLLDGTIDALIDQNPRVEAREALSLLECAVRGLPHDAHPPRLQVIFRENIPGA